MVVVAQSLGGFTAPLVCDRVPVELLILVARTSWRTASRHTPPGRD
jgi:hypothetical protein